MIEMQQAAIESLQPNPFNSNVVSAENEAKLDESLRRFGLFKPIIVRELEDGSKEIIGGEHRWRAAVRAGYREVPIVNLGRINDKKAKEISLVDNGRYGEDDALALHEILKDLDSDLVDYLPYSEAELEALVSATDIDLDSLGLDDLGHGDEESAAIEAATKAPKTHVIMRFKVPIGDSESIQGLIEATMRSQGFDQDDSLTNAGNALVHLLVGGGRE